MGAILDAVGVHLVFRRGKQAPAGESVVAVPPVQRDGLLPVAVLLGEDVRSVGASHDQNVGVERQAIVSWTRNVELLVENKCLA